MDSPCGERSAYKRNKWMASLFGRRPSARATARGADGTVNAAPFWMFNRVGEDPPLVMVSVNRHHADGRMKDTAANILSNGEFVVHLPDEGIAGRMHRCAEPLPAGVSEVDAVGFTTAASSSVRVPRIEEAPVAFECVLHEQLVNESRYVFFGRVQVLHAREGLIDTERWRVRLQDYFPVARFGASFYVNTRERFSIDGADREARTTSIDEI